MKFIYGLIAGIFISSLFFSWYAKKHLTVSERHSTSTATEENAEAPLGKEGDFLSFYERFHEDSAFQMAHITFPLEGLPRRDSTGGFPEDFRWQKEGWQLHHAFDPSDERFVQTFTAIGDAMVVEEIGDAKGMFSMQRRFAKIGGKWHLIYYATMNMIASEGGE